MTTRPVGTEEGWEGVPCTCGSHSVMDERQHAEDCKRRLLTERDDARAEVKLLREALREAVAFMADQGERLDRGGLNGSPLTTKAAELRTTFANRLNAREES